MSQNNKTISRSGITRSRKNRISLPSHLKPRESTSALVIDAGKYYQCLEHIEVELFTLPNGQVIEVNPQIVDRSLTRKQHLKLWGEPSLLRQGKPFTTEPVYKREGSKSHIIRVDEDAVLRVTTCRRMRRGV